MKNPIINSPYKEPTLHFKVDERGISDEVLEFRRPSTRYVSAMPRTRKRDGQLTMNRAEGALNAEMQEDNEFINKFRFIINEVAEKGATRQGFTKAQIEKFEIPIIPLDEQRCIVAQRPAPSQQLRFMASGR